MRIQHNIQSLNAQRNLTKNNNALNKNIEKLSSGYRINRAGDDAAGLAISEKMRGQIRGLNQAVNNANDGISLIKTAEGALDQTHQILQRMRELSVQSANGTYQNEVDRENINKEVEALKSEIDRISSSTHFNKINLLDGSMQTTGKLDENEKVVESLSVKGGNFDPSTVTIKKDAITTDANGKLNIATIDTASFDVTGLVDDDGAGTAFAGSFVKKEGTDNVFVYKKDDGNSLADEIAKFTGVEITINVKENATKDATEATAE